MKSGFLFLFLFLNLFISCKALASQVDTLPSLGRGDTVIVKIIKVVSKAKALIKIKLDMSDVRPKIAFLSFRQ